MPGKLKVLTVDRKQRNRNPAPPFTTSTLQQEAARKLGFSAQRTMRLAQQLYEGVDYGEGAVGLITDAVQAEHILESGKADAILVARAAMRNPHFALEAAEQLGETIEWPPQLDRARRVKQRA